MTKAAKKELAVGVKASDRVIEPPVAKKASKKSARASQGDHSTVAPGDLSSSTQKQASAKLRAHDFVSTATTMLADEPNRARNKLVLHSSFILGDLPVDLKAVYGRTLQQILASSVKKVPDFEVLAEKDNATLVLEVDSKEAAQAMYKRLQNAHVYGRRWKVEYMPLEAAVANTSEPVVVEVCLNPPGLKSEVQEALSGLRGFLAVDDWPAAADSHALTPDSPQQRAEASPAHRDPTSSSTASMLWVKETPASRFVATFAEEGPAIHARATISGRRVGSTGSRMFLSVGLVKPAAAKPLPSSAVVAKKKAH